MQTKWTVRPEARGEKLSKNEGEDNEVAEQEWAQTQQPLAKSNSKNFNVEREGNVLAYEKRASM